MRPNGTVDLPALIGQELRKRLSLLDSFALLLRTSRGLDGDRLTLVVRAGRARRVRQSRRPRYSVASREAARQQFAVGLAVTGRQVVVFDFPLWVV